MAWLRWAVLPFVADWRSRAIVVCDGGPYFFGAEMDVAANRLSHLAFNGPG